MSSSLNINPLNALNRDSLYWKLTSSSVAPGYPRQVSSDWPGLPDSVQAGFTWRDSGATYIFRWIIFAFFCLLAKMQEHLCLIIVRVSFFFFCPSSNTSN